MNNLSPPPSKPAPEPAPEPPPKRLIPPVLQPVTVQYWQQQRRPMEHVVFACSMEFHVPIEVIRGSSRKAPAVLARSVVFYLGSQMLGLSLTQLGKLVGRRDHTTVLHAIRSVAQRTKEDILFAARVEQVRREIAGWMLS